jgi:hypothetical protein
MHQTTNMLGYHRNADGTWGRRTYPPQDAEQLGQHYINHVDAMTTEALNRKSDIAAQLAWRDQQIESLKAQLARARYNAITDDELQNATEGLLSRIQYDQLLANLGRATP